MFQSLKKYKISGLITFFCCIPFGLTAYALFFLIALFSVKQVGVLLLLFLTFVACLWSAINGILMMTTKKTTSKKRIVFRIIMSLLFAIGAIACLINMMNINEIVNFVILILACLLLALSVYFNIDTLVKFKKSKPIDNNELQQ